MTPAAFARVLVRNAYSRNTHPDLSFISEASGIPMREVSDIAASERPLIPNLPVERAPLAREVDPAGGVVPSPGGQVRHYVTAIHHAMHADGSVLYFLGCVCGELLRARAQELPNHWRRHAAGLQ